MSTFDDFLKKKLQEKHFSPSEEQVSSFAEMLDGEEDRKRFIWWPWLVGMGVLVLGAFLLQDVIHSPDMVAKADLTKTVEPGTTQIEIENKANTTFDHVRENDLKQTQSNSAKAFVLPAEKISTPIKSFIQTIKNEAGTPSQSEIKGLENVSPLLISASTQSKEEVEDTNPSGELTKSDIPNGVIPQILESGLPSTHEITTYPGKSRVTIDLEKSAGEILRIPAIVYSEIPTIDLSSILILEKDREILVAATPPVIIVRSTKLGIDMGWGLASVKNGSLKEKGQRLHIGAFAEKNLNSKFSLQLGVGFQYENDALDFTKESTVSSQGFGLRSTVNTLDINSLYQVYLNAGLKWRKGRHTISSLIQLGYVYGAKGDLVRYSESTFEGVSEERINNVWLAVKGLNRWPVDLKLDYGYTISLNLQLRFGLTVPVISEMKNFPQEVTSTHVIDSRRNSLYPQLGIRYNLFKM